MNDNLFAEVKKLNKQIRELLAENERLRNRVAELEAGYREAIDSMQDECSAATPRDQIRYELQFEVDAHRAVLAGVIESVSRYKAYLQYQLDGGAL